MENKNKKNINNNPEENKESKDKKRKSVILAIVMIFLSVYAFNTVKMSMGLEEITYNKFIEMVENKEIEKVLITDSEIKITPILKDEKDKKVLFTGNMRDQNLTSQLTEAGVDFNKAIVEQNYIIEFIMGLITTYIINIFSS